MTSTTDRHDDRPLLTVTEAARRLGIGRSSAYQLVKDGALETVKVLSDTRIAPAEVDRYIRERTVPRRSAPARRPGPAVVTDVRLAARLKARPFPTSRPA